MQRVRSSTGCYRSFLLIPVLPSYLHHTTLVARLQLRSHISADLSFGIYTSLGYSVCNLGGHPTHPPGSYSHESADAKTFASWGVDYLKGAQRTVLCVVYFATMMSILMKLIGYRVRYISRARRSCTLFNLAAAALPLLRRRLVRPAWAPHATDYADHVTGRDRDGPPHVLHVPLPGILLFSALVVLRVSFIYFQCRRGGRICSSPLRVRREPTLRGALSWGMPQG